MPARQCFARRAAVTVCALALEWPRRVTPASLIRLCRDLTAAMLLLCASPAAAEIGVTASIFSDLQFRGYSLSSGHPVALLDFAYDDPSGAYAALSASAVADDGVRPLGVQANLGYAKAIGSATTVDFGISHSNYSEHSSDGSSTSYTEAYLGLAHKALSARIYFSPHYFEKGTRTIYAEVNGGFSPAVKWSVDGHVGMLVPVSTRPTSEVQRTQFDWRAGLSREVGRASLHLALSGAGPGHDYYEERPHHRTALVAGVSLPL